MTLNAFPANEQGFVALRDSVAKFVDLSGRLPAWPFRENCGNVTIFEYDRVVGGSFGAVLAELADAHGDEDVTGVTIEPWYQYYRDAYGYFAAFRIAREDVRAGYYDAMYFEPGGDPTGALGFTVNRFAITGSSNTWGVFADRDWEIGLLLTPERKGGWLTTRVPGFGGDLDLEEIRSPAGWGMPLSEADLDEFSRNIREHENGI